eukprot:RCo006284
MVDWAPWSDGVFGGASSSTSLDDLGVDGDGLGTGDEPGESTSGSRDCLLFLIDSSPSMMEATPDGEIPFQGALQYAELAYTKKVVTGENDLLGVVFYGTGASRTTYNIPGVYVFHDFGPPDSARIREITDLVRSEAEFRSFVGKLGHYRSGDSTRFPLSEALWQAQHLFHGLPKAVGFRRIFLFTDDECLASSDAERVKCQVRAKDLADSRVSLTLFAQRRPVARALRPVPPSPAG